MKALYRSALLATVPIIGIAIGLSGCKTAAAPGDVCSAASTYTTMTGLMTANVKQPQNAAVASSALTAKISHLIKFTLPTVESIDQSTKKVSCHAVMTVTSTPEAIKAARGSDVSREVMLAMLSGDQITPDALEPPVPINDQAADHISFQISYTVQPTADGSQTVVYLQQIGTLAKIVFAAVEEAEKPAPVAPPPASNDSADNSADATAANDPSMSEGCKANPEGAYCNTRPQADPAAVGGAKAGMPYSQVRKLLIANGFEPVERKPDDFCGEASSCSFPETQTCTGTGVELCISAFKKGDQYLEVDGEGEQDDQPVTALTFNDTRPGD